MTNEASLTVDSFHGFKYKKKFSFTRKNERDETNDDDDDNKQSDSEVATMSQSPSKKPYQLKGTAKLKSVSRESLSSSEDEKPVKKVSKKKRKNSSSEEDAQVELIEKDLNKLYKLHSKIPQARVKSVFFEQNFNVKKAIDILVNEEINEDSGSDTIEEWSDGDEKISASNKAKKQDKKNKKKNRISDESTASSSLGSEASNDNKKRKTENKIEDTKQPAKKMRRVVIESDENDDDDDESTRTSIRSTSTTTSNSQKKKIVESSASETEEKVKKSKHKKEKKKSKKKKSKKKPIEDDEDGASVGGSADEYYSEGDSENSDAEEQLSEDQKSSILKLFNESSVEDIQSMMSISTKRLETLLSLRPFKDFDDLKKKLSQRSLLPYIESAKDIIHARGMVNDLLEKCKRISERMEKQVSALIDQSSDNTESSSKSTKLEIKTQPKLLNKELQLKPYQLIGLNWLCLMHKENINGILADEMGLGKTCQTISFLTHLLETNPRLTHLIIVPPSTLDNWVRELSTWSPHFYFTVYQGNLEERRELRFNVLNKKFEKHLNCILTTYGLISSTPEDRAFFKKLQVEYCVFDEAHMLKNMNSQRYQSLIQIKSRRKLLLTGTPLQNNIVELMSLLYFVMPDIFHLKTQYLNKIFASKPANVDKDTFYAEKIAQAKGIMKPFILRRLKTEVLKQLPKKSIEVIHCDMTQRQTKEYGVLVEYYKKRKDQLLKEAEAAVIEASKVAKPATGTKYDDVLEIIEQNVANQRESAKKQASKKKNVKEIGDSSSNIIMELRKAANHPLLRRTYYTDDKLKQMAKIIMKESSPDTVFDYVVEDMSVLNDFQIHKLCPLYKGLKGHELNESMILDSGKFTVLDSILEEKKESGDRVLIFSQFVIMLDIVEEFLKIKSYKYLRLDGTTAVNDRQDLIDNYNENNDIFVFLLSTKAGGMGINLTAANVCIMHDIDFNPFNDKQAEDRCHRVGQTKEVQVYKLLSKNTIDETMMKIQEKKLELGADISGENDTHSKSDMVSMLKEALNF